MCFAICGVALALLCVGIRPAAAVDLGGVDWRLAGTVVVPHVQSTEMRFRREPDRSLGARVQVLLENVGGRTITLPGDEPIRLRDGTPAELLAADEWAWHDLPEAWTDAPLVVPPGGLVVWTWNGKRAAWGVGTAAELTLPGGRLQLAFDAPQVWISSLTLPGKAEEYEPRRLVFHVANASAEELQFRRCRWWLPRPGETSRVLYAQPWLEELECFPASGRLPPGDRACVRTVGGPWPATYGALEVELARPSGEALRLWAHQRIKREAFDISGGWTSSDVGGRNSLTIESYLKSLQYMHVNTAHIEQVSGYTDNNDIYIKYPLKYFHRLMPLDIYDRDEILPRVHAVEFLGEPQYGGGRPVPPMEVWQALRPYRESRLPTTLTLSSERDWRFYSGLSDYPHYDAYRITAPAADAWASYDRWAGKRIRWGAPLETIGSMTRSLRELSRPAPIAYWSQGAHHGWGGFHLRLTGRERASPTAEELRAQAYHALSSRITSLYWFNLSVASLQKFPDLIEPIQRVGREIRMLEDYYLEGDAYFYERQSEGDRPMWDLAVIASPRGAVCFTLDLDYQPDPEQHVFRFGAARRARFRFPLPAYLRDAQQVLRVDAQQVVSVPFQMTAEGIVIETEGEDVNLFVVSDSPATAGQLEERQRALIAAEQALGFDPAELQALKNDADR